MRNALLVGLMLLAAACAGTPANPQLNNQKDAVKTSANEARFGALPILSGDYFRIDSNVVGRAYHVHVAFPEGYDPNKSELYPIVYLLDADSLFGVVAASQLFLTYDDQAPKAIIVGIAYGSFAPEVNKRTMDFSSPAANALRGQGGAAVFNTFLRSELIPLVEARYRADPARRILYGQARSGHFVLYSAFSDPDLFWGRIAYNPSFEPGMTRYYQAPALATRTNLRLVVASGTRDRPHNRAHFEAWRAAWESRPDKPWMLAMPDIVGGTHSYDTASAYRVGMHFIQGRPIEQ